MPAASKVWEGPLYMEQRVLSVGKCNELYSSSNIHGNGKWLPPQLVLFASGIFYLFVTSMFVR